MMSAHATDSRFAWTRRGSSLGLVLLILCVWNSNGLAQSVIQLPSFSSFSYNGTVLVPDSGAGFAGGVRRSASRQSRRGHQRNVGQGLGAAGASVSPTIIDLQELDRQILGGTPQEFQRRNSAGKNSAGKNLLAERTAEGKALVRYARKQYKSGNKYGAAYAYRMAIDLLDGRLRQLAIAEYRRLY